MRGLSDFGQQEFQTSFSAALHRARTYPPADHPAADITGECTETALDVGVPPDTQLSDGSHELQQTIRHSSIDILRATQIALIYAMLFRLSDVVPCVKEQQIVDAPILQSERR